jgi:hypothetical protein
MHTRKEIDRQEESGYSLAYSPSCERSERGEKGDHMKKPRVCCRCGEPKSLLFKGTMVDQYLDEKGGLAGVELPLKWNCMPCLLSALRLTTTGIKSGNYYYKKAARCVDEKKKPAVRAPKMRQWGPGFRGGTCNDHR